MGAPIELIINPPDPDFESKDGDKKVLKASYDAKLAFWLRAIQWRIPAGFVSDGASVPRAMRWLYDRQSLGSLAPLLHDWGCEYEGVIINFRGETLQLPYYVVHTIFLLCLLIDGVPWPRAFNCFIAVATLGPKWPKYPPERIVQIRDRMLKEFPELVNAVDN